MDETKTVRQVIEEVGAKHGVSYIDMISNRRVPLFCKARQEAYYRCATETVFSYAVIGRCFGHRDHSTILKGSQKYKMENGL